MQHITLETRIAAPLERCFLLALSIDLHQDLAKHTGERAIAGVTHGLIGAGEKVRWKGRHFGVTLQHESLISGYDRPTYFQDSMVRGAFQYFVHEHFFIAVPNGTLMRDELRFAAPLGLLGRIAEYLLLRRHMHAFLTKRNAEIKAVAEGPAEIWERYLAQA